MVRQPCVQVLPGSADAGGKQLSLKQSASAPFSGVHALPYTASLSMSARRRSRPLEPCRRRRCCCLLERCAVAIKPTYAHLQRAEEWVL